MQILDQPNNVGLLMDLPGRWIDQVRQQKPVKEVILDMDSSVSPTHGEQQGSANRTSADAQPTPDLTALLAPTALPVLVRAEGDDSEARLDLHCHSTSQSPGSDPIRRRTPSRSCGQKLPAASPSRYNLQKETALSSAAQFNSFHRSWLTPRDDKTLYVISHMKG